MGHEGYAVATPSRSNGSALNNVMSRFSLQKKSELKARWHADFRLVDQLPDIKVVRTKFIVNFIFLAIFFALLVVVGYREISKIGLRQSISSLQSEVDSRSGPNKQLTTLSRDFRMLANKMDDIKSFKDAPIRPAWLLIELSRIRTQDVVYDAIGYENFWDNTAKEEIYKVRLSGKGRTTADIAELKSRLAILEVGEEWVINVLEEGNPSKDSTSGIFSFVIALEISKVKDGNQ